MPAALPRPTPRTLQQQRYAWYARLAAVVLVAMALKVAALGYFLATGTPIPLVNLMIWAGAGVGVLACIVGIRRVNSSASRRNR